MSRTRVHYSRVTSRLCLEFWDLAAGADRRAAPESPHAAYAASAAGNQPYLSLATSMGPA
ncbi:MAG: hypothetical protein M3P93_08285 [Actinomycetota bacterium]|nr:hypothetical protein [Actinomycetota bacterium]